MEVDIWRRSEREGLRGESGGRVRESEGRVREMEEREVKRIILSKYVQRQRINVFLQ